MTGASILSPGATATRDVLRDHPGFLPQERLKSYETSVRVFAQTLDDLFFEMRRFGDLVNAGSVFNSASANVVDDIEHKIQKELFAAANAARAMINHSIRLQQVMGIASYEEKKVEFFGSDGLGEFVFWLRNIIHHVHMTRPNWRITRRFGKEGQTTTFRLDTDELLAIARAETRKRSVSVQAYLENAGESIDLRQVFEDYRRRADAFHTWFSEAIASEPPELVGDMRDYERCLMENEKVGTRTVWKMLVGNWLNWDEPPNPYDYLDRYLTVEQLQEVRNLPMKSEEQVNKVIEFVDTDSACDHELRERIHRLFARANPPTEDRKLGDNSSH